MKKFSAFKLSRKEAAKVLGGTGGGTGLHELPPPESEDDFLGGPATDFDTGTIQTGLCYSKTRQEFYFCVRGGIGK